MKYQETILYSPNDVVGLASNEECKNGENPFAKRIKALVEHEEFESQYPKGLFQRETHSSEGEHVFLVYNDHRTLAEKKYIPPQYFIQVYLQGHSKTKPQMEEYKWDDNQDPRVLYPDRIDRIETLINLFVSETEGKGD